MSEYVSKNEVIEKIMENYPTMSHYLITNDFLIARRIYENILEDVETTKTVDVKPVVHGHWKYEQDEGHSIYTGECSVCGHRRRIDPFCGRCGAIMDESDDTE